MGYLLKEALKTLCGVNQWSYAVFWKIGCQNPKLLIWEECYYEPVPYSNFPGVQGVADPDMGFDNWDAWVSAEAGTSHLPASTRNKTHLLVNKMMMENHVNIIGQGLVGRAAFTRNHQWVLSDKFTCELHPQEVLKEVCEQFSAGMQTVAVIPVLPHGVVQLGSCFPIMEDLAFVNDVKSLVLQLGCVPGVLLSGSYGTEENMQNIGLPDYPLNDIPVNSDNYQVNPVHTAGFVNQTSCSSSKSKDGILKSSVTSLKSSKLNDPPNRGSNDYSRAKGVTTTEPNLHSVYRPPNGVNHLDMIHSTPDVWLRSFFDNQHSTFQDQSSVNTMLTHGGNFKPLEQRSLSDATFHNHADNKALKRDSMRKGAQDDFLKTISIFAAQDGEHMNSDKSISNFGSCDEKVFAHGSALKNSQYGDACRQPFTGEDLFDILGVDFKNKLLNGSWSGIATNESECIGQKVNKTISTSWLEKDAECATSDLYSVSQGNTESGIFSSTVSDHLLEAVVSKLHPSEKKNLDDSVSCKTTLSGMSSSVPPISRPYGCNIDSDQLQAEIFGIPKSLLKAGSLSSCSFMSGASKDNAGMDSPNSSMYRSQLSSWVEHSRETKQSSSASTAYSKKADEMSKTNRKRLKPGENPRPRPKDRQMIQDRVKELREIVPNGIKCSIDALLERTIKHMLFLQSVTKHADKLKQTGEPKMLSREGGLLLKDNFEGGATWAYEVGSQSMVCPIIVEDLNQPRQMLVEMLCEEGGLFLEIADIIKGLGLTILKGVMETRNEKIWARFAVEANRDVTRMEIFISLVRLLEQTTKGDATPSSGIDSSSTIAHQFHQTS